jgi:hypothetical protein
MPAKLTRTDIEVILESLAHYKKIIQNDEGHSYDFRQTQLKRVEAAIRGAKSLQGKKAAVRKTT